MALVLFTAISGLPPAVFLVFVNRIARAVFFVLGLIFGFGIEHVMELGGPDSPGLIIPMFGFAIAAGAIIAELIVALWSLITGKPKQCFRIKFKSSIGYRQEEPGY